MIHEINYTLYLMIGVAIVWPLVFLGLIMFDYLQGDKFRPFYRAVWPFVIVLELIAMLD